MDTAVIDSKSVDSEADKTMTENEMTEGIDDAKRAGMVEVSAQAKALTVPAWLKSRYANIAMLVVALLLLWLILLSVLFPSSQNNYQLSAQLQDPAMGQWRWFDVAAPTPPPKQITRTKIKAELVGLIYTDDRRVAIITTSGKPNKLYKESDSIEQGVTVKSIEPNRVILDEHGAERELLMAKNTTDKMKLLNGPQQPTKAVAEEAEAGEKLPGSEAFTDFVDVLSVRTPDGSSGLKLRSLNSDIVELSGLQAEDVVVNVNQISVLDIVNNPDQIRQLLTNDSATVEIVRDGVPQTISVDVKTLAARMIPLLGNR